MNAQNPYQALAKSVASHPHVSGGGQIAEAMEGLCGIIEWESRPCGTKLETVRQQLSLAERSVAEPILAVAVNMLLCAVVHYAGQGEWDLSAEQVQQVEHVDRAVMKSVAESTRFVEGPDVARRLDDWAKTLNEGMGQSGGIDDRDRRLAEWLVERLHSCRELVQTLPFSDEKLRAVLDCVARPPRRAIHAAGVAPATLQWQRELVLLDMKIERLIVGWLADHRVALI
ncbi:MAG: hypothetical protein H3C58_09880, partial [Fimbriimonadaceae bacterium]|nr:hypothetical protein [Fimbriimonadaceae bacterium]